MREEIRSHSKMAQLAARQYGIVSARQLGRLGYSSSTVGRALRAGRLLRVHRGVYAVGHSCLSRHGLSLAAVAATAPGSVLSHCSAAWLWGFDPTFVRPIEVTVPRTGKRRRDVVVHHAPDLADAERTRYERIPVTSAPRTLFDLAATASDQDLASAVDRAKRRGKLDLIAIDELLARRRGEAGTVALRAAVDLYRASVSDRAKSELLFLELVRDAGLPEPALNTWVGEFEIDAWWKSERFAVEVDGWETHGDRRSFEADRLRIEDMRLAGIDAIRITARRIEREPVEVARRLALHLHRRRRELGA